MILVDSSVWIDYFNGVNTPQVDVLDGILGQELIIIGDLILTEVLQGFSKDTDFNTAKKVFENMPYFDLVGKKIALMSAENYRYLKKKGITVRKTVDVIIGTFCIVNDFILLHSDKDYDPMEKQLGLKIYR